MQLSVTHAKARLTELVRRVESGEDVVLTRHGQPVARLAPVTPMLPVTERAALIREIRAAGRGSAGPDAAHSQDFLYDDAGLPS